MKHQVKRISGFTLIEVLLVLVIIGVLASLVVPSVAGRGEEARRAAARADIEANLAAALDMYEMDNGRYPTTEQGLTALIEKPSQPPVPRNWQGPYLKKRRRPLDPWGNPYHYRYPGEHHSDGYDLWSTGADGVDSEDDIRNGESGDDDG